jgi:hypothetical protein
LTLDTDADRVVDEDIDEVAAAADDADEVVFLAGVVSVDEEGETPGVVVEEDVTPDLAAGVLPLVPAANRADVEDCVVLDEAGVLADKDDVAALVGDVTLRADGLRDLDDDGGDSDLADATDATSSFKRRVTK